MQSLLATSSKFILVSIRMQESQLASKLRSCRSGSSPSITRSLDLVLCRGFGGYPGILVLGCRISYEIPGCRAMDSNRWLKDPLSALGEILNRLLFIVLVIPRISSAKSSQQAIKPPFRCLTATRDVVRAGSCRRPLRLSSEASPIEARADEYLELLVLRRVG
jgi:hypothetical protein